MTAEKTTNKIDADETESRTPKGLVTDAGMEIPRRRNIDLFTPAELAIWDAIGLVEVLPADIRLTDAVVLLEQAREKVADFVDGVDQVDHGRSCLEIEAERNQQQVDQSPFMYDPEYGRVTQAHAAELAAKRGIIGPGESRGIRSNALEKASHLFQGCDLKGINPAEWPNMLVKAATEFEAYLRGGATTEGVPAAAAKREELVDGMERQPERETKSPEFDKWAEDRKFNAEPDAKFEPTEHDKS